MCRNISTIILTFFSWVVFSQNLKEDFRSIAAHVDSSQSVFIEVKIDVYQGVNGRKIYSTNALSCKSSEGFYSKLGGLEVVANSNYEIRIDHESLTMLVLEKKEKIQPVKSNEQTKIDLDGIKKMLDSITVEKEVEIKLKSDRDGIRVYNITNASYLKSMEVTLDMNNFCIKDIKYQYDGDDMGNQYVVLNYHKFEYNRNLSDRFSTDKYFNIINEEYIPKAEYKEYRIYTYI